MKGHAEMMKLKEARDEQLKKTLRQRELHAKAKLKQEQALVSCSSLVCLVSKHYANWFLQNSLKNCKMKWYERNRLRKIGVKLKSRRLDSS